VGLEATRSSASCANPASYPLAEVRGEAITTGGVQRRVYSECGPTRHHSAFPFPSPVVESGYVPVQLLHPSLQAPYPLAEVRGEAITTGGGRRRVYSECGPTRHHSAFPFPSPAVESGHVPVQLLHPSLQAPYPLAAGSLSKAADLAADDPETRGNAFERDPWVAGANAITW
jgi:glyoxylase-like metal-dependent hydrolase (beta-lactamase superfamily II)